MVRLEQELMSSLCYFVNILDLVWLWVFPQSTSLFIASYLLTMGKLLPSQPALIMVG
jgi:hypothetical protein